MPENSNIYKYVQYRELCKKEGWIVSRQFEKCMEEDSPYKKLEAKAIEMKTPAFKKFIKEWGWLVNQKSISFGDYCF